MVARLFPRSGKTHAHQRRIRIGEKGQKTENVIVVKISSSILIKNLRRICNEKIYAMPISDNNIMIYGIILSLYMVEVRGSTPLSPTHRD